MCKVTHSKRYRRDWLDPPHTHTLRNLMDFFAIEWHRTLPNRVFALNILILYQWMIEHFFANCAKFSWFQHQLELNCLPIQHCQRFFLPVPLLLFFLRSEFRYHFFAIHLEWRWTNDFLFVSRSRQHRDRKLEQFPARVHWKHFCFVHERSK